jgi:hypothetical protein
MLRNVDGRLQDPVVFPIAAGVAAAGKLTRSDREQLVFVHDNKVKVTSFDDDGELGEVETVAPTPLGWPPAFDGIALDDIDGDGRLDIALGNGAVLLQHESGVFRTETVDPNMQPVNGTVSLGDIDGDGRPEIAIAEATALIDFAGSVRVYGRNADGAYRKLHDGSAQDNHPQSVALADVNGDGRADLILPGFDTGNIYVASAKADGSFGPFETIHVRRRADQYGGAYYARVFRTNGKAAILSPAGDEVAIVRMARTAGANAGADAGADAGAVNLLLP